MFSTEGDAFCTPKCKISFTKDIRASSFRCKTKPAIIAITETWLDKSVTEGEVGIDGYTLQRNDRNRSGGGVCLYIQNRYAFTSMNIIDSDEYESLWINIFLPKTKPIQVGVCYRPPSQANFLELFEKSLSQLRSDCEIYILGDFNIDFHQSHSLFKAYKQVINLFDLKQMIDQPTRITESTKSTIDHSLTNRNENLSQHGTIPIGLSDHFITPLSVSQVLNSHSHVMYILSILLAKYTEIKVSLKSRKTMA